MSKHQFTKNDIKIIEKTNLYRGFFELNQYKFTHKLFAGNWSDTVIREVFERGHAVVVLPYDPIRDEVVLIEQVRLPALETSVTPWLYELVAGIIETNESLEEVAKRELFEESGLTAQSLHLINSYLVSPGGSTERCHLFLAEVDASLARGIHGLAQEHEDIQIQVMSRNNAYNLMDKGEIDNASAIIGLQWLQLNYHKFIK